GRSRGGLSGGDRVRLSAPVGECSACWHGLAGSLRRDRVQRRRAARQARAGCVSRSGGAVGRARRVAGRIRGLRERHFGREGGRRLYDRCAEPLRAATRAYPGARRSGAGLTARVLAGYAAVSWKRRRRQGECSAQAVLKLLFAQESKSRTACPAFECNRKGAYRAVAGCSPLSATAGCVTTRRRTSRTAFGYRRR